MSKPITWRNVNAPNNGTANQLLQNSQKTILDSIGGAKDMLQDRYDHQVEQNTDAYLNALQQYGTAEAVQGAINSGALSQQLAGYGNYIDHDQVRAAAQDRLHSLQDRDNTLVKRDQDAATHAANLAGIELGNTKTQQDIDHDDVFNSLKIAHKNAEIAGQGLTNQVTQQSIDLTKEMNPIKVAQEAVNLEGDVLGNTRTQQTIDQHNKTDPLAVTSKVTANADSEQALLEKTYAHDQRVKADALTEKARLRKEGIGDFIGEYSDDYDKTTSANRTNIENFTADVNKLFNADGTVNNEVVSKLSLEDVDKYITKYTELDGSIVNGTDAISNALRDARTRFGGKLSDGERSQLTNSLSERQMVPLSAADQQVISVKKAVIDKAGLGTGFYDDYDKGLVGSNLAHSVLGDLSSNGEDESFKEWMDEIGSDERRREFEDVAVKAALSTHTIEGANGPVEVPVDSLTLKHFFGYMKDHWLDNDFEADEALKNSAKVTNAAERYTKFAELKGSLDELNTEAAELSVTGAARNRNSLAGVPGQLQQVRDTVQRRTARNDFLNSLAPIRKAIESKDPDNVDFLFEAGKVPLPTHKLTGEPLKVGDVVTRSNRSISAIKDKFDLLNVALKRAGMSKTQ